MSLRTGALRAPKCAAPESHCGCSTILASTLPCSAALSCWMKLNREAVGFNGTARAALQPLNRVNPATILQHWTYEICRSDEMAFTCITAYQAVVSVFGQCKGVVSEFRK